MKPRFLAVPLLVAAVLAAGARAAPLTLEGPFGAGPSQVWLLEPAGDVQAVVVFGHGWKARPPSPSGAWVAQFAPWLRHLLARGDAVIFPRYQLGGDTTGPARVRSYREGLALGFARLGAPNVPVVVVGYSYGASLAFSYAANARRWGLPAVRAVDAVFPAAPVAGTPLPRLERTVRVLIQVGDGDTEAGDRGAAAFWQWLGSHPRSNKRYVVVRSAPGFAVTHAAPKLATAAARRAFWAPLDALLAGRR